MIRVTGVSADAQALADTLARSGVASAIARKDSSLWGLDAQPEASIRLGWTDDAREMADLVDTLAGDRDALHARGINRVILCGMGGSSLAPEVIATRNGLPLTILDSTHPDQVHRAIDGDLSDVLVVVSSKSGTTVETASARAAFASAFSDRGLDPKEHMVVVTDPNSPLEQESRADGFRVVNADPTVGGRFSALTAFGLVPSILAGADGRTLIADASAARAQVSVDSVDNPALTLAAVMANPATPYLAVVSDGDSLAGFGDWVEQLVAESTGKEGLGVLPVVVIGPEDPLIAIRPRDVVFVGVSESAETVPGCDVTVTGGLGEQFVAWQWATAIAAIPLGINPFDQPDVESAKVAARSLLSSRPEASSPLFQDGGVGVSGLGVDLEPEAGLSGVWKSVATRVPENGYIALQVYADREDGTDWSTLHDSLTALSGRPVTLGFGPRFLHSTGQFHKGGRQVGVFVQVEVTPVHRVTIPGYPYDFGQLIDAQSAGDREVLAARGLPVVTLRLPPSARGELMSSVVSHG
jgi:glucose-6-phosphate isomerase